MFRHNSTLTLRVCSSITSKWRAHMRCACFFMFMYDNNLIRSVFLLCPYSVGLPSDQKRDPWCLSMTNVWSNAYSLMFLQFVTTVWLDECSLMPICCYCYQNWIPFSLYVTTVWHEMCFLLFIYDYPNSKRSNSDKYFYDLNRNGI